MSTITLQFPLKCHTCMDIYSVLPSRLWLSKYCSKSCAGKGSPWTPERKAKIGAANSGPRDATRGDKNYNWKGGSQNSMSRAARERDQDICQCVGTCGWHVDKTCGFSDSLIMHVDHVKPKVLFPQLRYDLANLLTLCPNCHQMKTNTERRANIFKK